MLAHTSAAAMVSWWTVAGPSVSFQETITGNLIYSSCGTGRVGFPRREPNMFETDQAPRWGTSLAAAGWLDTSSTIWVCMVDELQWTMTLI